MVNWLPGGTTGSGQRGACGGDRDWLLNGEGGTGDGGHHEFVIAGIGHPAPAAGAFAGDVALEDAEPCGSGHLLGRAWGTAEVPAAANKRGGVAVGILTGNGGAVARRHR